MEINKKDLLPLSFLQKSPYTGSFQGIRYRIEKQEEGECKLLLVYTWPEPYAFSHTPEEEKEKKSFPFSEKGLEEIRLYLSSLGNE
ncbi:hypothetical protein [Oribacterium parvum]